MADFVALPVILFYYYQTGDEMTCTIQEKSCNFRNQFEGEMNYKSLSKNATQATMGRIIAMTFIDLIPQNGG